MAVVIRLARTGKKGERRFRIVLKEKRSRRDGSVIEYLGWHEKGPQGKTELHKERFEYWRKQGAIISPAVTRLVEKSS